MKTLSLLAGTLLLLTSFAHADEFADGEMPLLEVPAMIGRDATLGLAAMLFNSHVTYGTSPTRMVPMIEDGEVNWTSKSIVNQALVNGARGDASPTCSTNFQFLPGKNAPRPGEPWAKLEIRSAWRVLVRDKISGHSATAIKLYVRHEALGSLSSITCTGVESVRDLVKKVLKGRGSVSFSDSSEEASTSLDKPAPEHRYAPYLTIPSVGSAR